MLRRTVSQALASRIPSSLNLLSSDPRVLQYINACTERLLHRGHWPGTVVKYTINVTDQLFTLPPQFATTEQLAICQWPVTLRNHWYEFNPGGWGVSNDPSSSDLMPCNGRNALQRGNACVFKDISPGGRKLRFQCDVAADIGVKMLTLGYDDSGNWIRTQVAGVWQDGELVALAQSPGTLSVTNFSRITGIQKPVTSGQVWLYQWDGATNMLIGNYQYWETNPFYPRYLLPVVSGSATQIDLMGKAEFYPVANPTDWLILSNLEALRLGCMSVQREEQNMLSEAALLMNGGMTKSGQRIDGAITLLNDELQHVQGDGVVPAPQWSGSSIGELDPVANVI